MMLCGCLLLFIEAEIYQLTSGCVGPLVQHLWAQEKQREECTQEYPSTSEWAGKSCLLVMSHQAGVCDFSHEGHLLRTLLTKFLMLFLGCELLVQNSAMLESIGPGEQYTPSLKIMSPLGFAARLPVRAPFLLQAQAGETAGSSFSFSRHPCL